MFVCCQLFSFPLIQVSIVPLNNQTLCSRIHFESISWSNEKHSPLFFEESSFPIVLSQMCFALFVNDHRYSWNVEIVFHFSSFFWSSSLLCLPNCSFEERIFVCGQANKPAQSLLFNLKILIAPSIISLFDTLLFFNTSHQKKTSSLNFLIGIPTNLYYSYLSALNFLFRSYLTFYLVFSEIKSIFFYFDCNFVSCQPIFFFFVVIELSFFLWFTNSLQVMFVCTNGIETWKKCSKINQRNQIVFFKLAIFLKWISSIISVLTLVWFELYFKWFGRLFNQPYFFLSSLPRVLLILSFDLVSKFVWNFF